MNLNNLLDPLSRNMHLVIIALYAYVLLCHVKNNEYVTMIFLTVATCMAICYLKKTEIGSVLDSNTTEGYCDQCGGGGIEGLENAKEPAKEPTKEPTKDTDLPNVMGPYDGLCLKTGNQEYWMKSPDNTSLIPDKSLFAFLSSQGPIKPVFTDNSFLHGPPIDGKKGSPEKMFMFANNRTSPSCCPGTYSTSTGCVCTTKGQRDFIASRGNNQGKIDLQDI